MLDLKSMNDEGLVDWLGNFAGKLRGAASTLGLKSSAVEGVEHSRKSFSTIVDAEKEAKSRNLGPQVADDLGRYKHFVRDGADDELRQKFPSAFEPIASSVPAGIIPRLIGFLESLRGRRGYTAEIGRDIGIATPEGTSIPQMVKSMDDLQTARWFDGVVNGLKRHRSDLSITDSEMDDAEKSHYAFSQLVHQRENATHEGKPQSLIQKLSGYLSMVKDGPSEAVTRAFPALSPMALAVVPGIVPQVTSLIGRLRGVPGFSAIAGSLGLAEERRAPDERRVPEERRREPVPAAREEHKGLPTWLLPVAALALIGILAWVFWPRNISARSAERPAGSAQLALSDVRAEPMERGAVVYWETNRDASSQIEYGKSRSLELTRGPKAVSAGKMITGHEVRLSGLAPRTQYYYRVHSTDASGRTVGSNIQSFTTR